MQDPALVRPAAQAGGVGARRVLIACALLLGGLCAALAVMAIGQQQPFSEYLGQARRCVELGDCPARGGRTGGLPLFHGASWIRLLAYAVRTSQELTAVQSIIAAMWLVSIPAAFAFLYRYAGLGGATLGLGLYYPVILVGTDSTIFTYTNLLPLPFVAYYAGMALFIESRRTGFAAAASVALAAAVSAELGGIVVVPFHFLVVALGAARPVTALAVCGLALAIPFWLDSSDAAIEILRQVPTARFAVALVICAAIAAPAILFGRRVLGDAAVPPAERVRTLMAAALIYSIATIWLGNLLLMGGVPAPRYLLPASVPWLFLVADRARRLPFRQTVALALFEAVTLVLLFFAPRGVEFLQVPVGAIVTVGALLALIRPRAWRGDGAVPARWPVIAVCVCALLVAAAEIVVSARRGAAQALTLAESEPVIRALYAAGYTYPQLLTALQGPAVDDMVSLVTERDPDLFSEPSPPLADPPASIVVLKVPDELVKQTSDVVAAVPSGGGRTTIAVRGERPYLDWSRMRRCRLRREGEAPVFVCEQPERAERLPRNWPYVRFAGADRRAAAGALAPRFGELVRIEVPVRTPGLGSPHIVRTANQWPSRWEIVAVEGVRFEGELPGPEVRLLDDAAADGLIVFEMAAPLPGNLPWVWMPDVTEVSLVNRHLIDALRDGR